MGHPDTTPRHQGRRLSRGERSELERRALVAFWQSNAVGKGSVPVLARCVSKKAPTLSEAGPLHYVVLHTSTEVLSVYRARPVKDFFMLRRLSRWPRDLVRL